MENEEYEMARRVKNYLLRSFFEKLDYELAEKLETVIEKGITNQLTHQEKLDALERFPQVFEYMAIEDKDNIEIAKVAVFQHTLMYIFCSDNLKHDKQFALDLATNGNIKYGDLGYFVDKFRSDKEIVLQIAKKDLEHAWSYSRNLEEFFKENLEGDKYDETCITLLRNAIHHEKMENAVPVKKISKAPRMKI